MERRLGAALVFLWLFKDCLGADLQTGLRMAHCRTRCLGQFPQDLGSASDGACQQNAHCLMCWAQCQKLSSAYPIWSYTCSQKDMCDPGCKTACDFHSEHRDGVVPLSQFNSRFSLVFAGWDAQWLLIWVNSSQTEPVVYALFTRREGRSWKLKLQTADTRASLREVPLGSEIKLVAVATSGLLSVIITPYCPPALRKAMTRTGHPIPQDDDGTTRDNRIALDDGRRWFLQHEARVEGTGLVAARVWWNNQGSYDNDYLVTWEVEGGGLKGHLYTDIPEVDLTLWPETVYRVQVEAVSSVTVPKASNSLILDTHNITEVVAQPREIKVTTSLPLPHQSHVLMNTDTVVVICLGACAIVIVFAVLGYKLLLRLREKPTVASSKLSFSSNLSSCSVDHTCLKKSDFNCNISKGFNLSRYDESVLPPLPNRPCGEAGHYPATPNVYSLPSYTPHRKISHI